MTPPRESGPASTDDVRRDLRVAAVAVGLAVAFALRMTVGDVGPVELLPVVAAATWLGVRAARVAAALASVLLVVAAVIGPDAASAAVTVVAVVAAAELTGRLLERIAAQRRELATLRPLQDALAPGTPPELPLLDLAVRYLPATPGVAGDFYLVAEGHNNSTIVAVGDVMGKGVKAAERATFIRATLAAVSSSTDDPAHLLRAANAQLVRQFGLSADFVTMLCVVVRPDASVLWASAGHPAPLSLADGSPLGRLTACFPLGIAPELAGLETVRSELPEAGMLLYTDGLTDAKPRSFEPLGQKRIGPLLRELDDPTPQRVVDHLAASAQRFAGRPLSDDVCLIAIRSKLAWRPSGLPAVAEPDVVAPPRRRRWLGPALVGVACGAAVVGAGVVAAGGSQTHAPRRVARRLTAPPVVVRRPTPPSRPHRAPAPRMLRLARLRNAPRRARGSALLVGGRLDLTVGGLGRRRARSGTVWLSSSSGGAIPIASFHGPHASLNIPLPPATSRYQFVTVSIRPGALSGPPANRVVLRAPLPQVTAPSLP